MEEDDYSDDDFNVGGTQSSDFDVGSDEDVELDDDEDAADEVFAPVVADRDRKKNYETDFTVHTIADIVAGQNGEISQVSGLLGCHPEHAATLLRHFKWNKERFMDLYFANPEGILAEAGVIIDDAKRPRFVKIKGFVCDICCADEADLESLALSCGHRYCRDCYEHYLTQKITEEGESRRIQCMHGKCKIIVDEKTVEMVSKPQVLAK
jgi:ariadne-1